MEQRFADLGDEAKRPAGKIRAVWNRIAGIRLRYRMFLIYILGGALPIILIGLYLMIGTSEILVKQAENAEAAEMEMIRRQTEEMLETVVAVTNYLYFDPVLEEIASKNYESYQDIVTDYKAFSSFLDYGRNYNNVIAWINIYIRNDTLATNSQFIKVTDSLAAEEWYAQAVEKKGRVVWRYRFLENIRYSGLALHRMLKTKKGEEVGILGIYLRPEGFHNIMQNGSDDSFIILNGEIEIYGHGSVSCEEILPLLPADTDGMIQKNIFLDKKEYVMTCETVTLMESEDYLQIVSLLSFENILREVRRQNTKSFVIFLISVFFSISIISLFSHSFSLRVEHFLEQMKKAAEGNFELEKDLGGNDEISDLYSCLCTMIYRIQKLLADIYWEKLHAERLMVKQKDAEFKMLASQINPHFLYNTLETIRMRARRSGQPDIEELVMLLAKIMRSNLRAGGSETTIRSEIELVECYLKIQKYRFAERICYRISLEEELASHIILPLMIQPIVENSIVHGLESKEGTGHIHIRVYTRGEKIVLSVEDDGLGIDAEQLEMLQKGLNSRSEKEKHIGISNVHQRVRLKYGEEYGVVLDSRKGIYTKVEIILPAVDQDSGR